MEQLTVCIIAITILLGVVYFLICDLLSERRVFCEPEKCARSCKLLDRINCARLGKCLDILLYDSHWRVRYEVAKKRYCLDVLICDTDRRVKKLALYLLDNSS